MMSNEFFPSCFSSFSTAAFSDNGEDRGMTTKTGTYPLRHNDGPLGGEHPADQ